ncbi:MAG: hypothetical protein A3E78_01215 [Alphaproteobacteria bacterium RIFCSPHIGHO2_12_FULL_63_12]|nr:MAG: hypothetical protein A3E78_01215 [Alphaproteobacteria bacterium RIFCSPHIGHO2_12_FULL_63_12]
MIREGVWPDAFVELARCLRQRRSRLFDNQVFSSWRRRAVALRENISPRPSRGIFFARDGDRRAGFCVRRKEGAVSVCAPVSTPTNRHAPAAAHAKKRAPKGALSNSFSACHSIRAFGARPKVSQTPRMPTRNTIHVAGSGTSSGGGGGGHSGSVFGLHGGVGGTTGGTTMPGTS